MDHDKASRNYNASEIWGVTGEAYDEISRGSADAVEHCLDRLRPRPGEAVLDVATGTGWTARRLAVRGAIVTGIDISSAIIDAARRLSTAEGLQIEFQVADAENLPFDQGQFDAVVSTFGVIFASNPQSTAAELARVCRHGGRLGLTAWGSDGVPAHVYQLLREYMPNAAVAARSPFEWGSIEFTSELLGGEFDLGFESGTSYLNLPDGKAVWDLYVASYGPLRWLTMKLSKEEMSELEERFVWFHNQFRAGLGVRVPREYLVTLGVRR